MEPSYRWLERVDVWSSLDGLQRLAWAAVARAVAEPELRLEVVRQVSKTSKTLCSNPSVSCETAYLWQLARELGTSPVRQWLVSNSSWSEILRLAFRYLDLDNDGLLGPQDIVAHLVLPGVEAADHADAWSAAHLWVARWGIPGSSGTGVDGPSFRAALLAAHREADSQAFDDGGEQEDENEEDELQGVEYFRGHV